MDKIIDREVAWRIFAHEFNSSSLYNDEGDERAPNYIITPTGAKCNRLFIAGVVTEVENISQDNSLFRARVADPTGVFTIYAGQYQPEVAIFLSELEVPAYVVLAGKARKYEPGEGSILKSIRPEEINLADEELRDRWVLETAERTVERIENMEEAVRSGLSGDELKDLLVKKGVNDTLADGTVRAIEHYDNLDKIMGELRTVIFNAVKTVAPGLPEKSPPAIDTGNEMEVTKKAAQETGLSPGSRDDVAGFLEDDTTGEPVISGDNEDLSQSVKEAGFEEDLTGLPGKEAGEEPDISGNDMDVPQEKEEEPEIKELIAAIIEKLDDGKGTPYSSIIDSANSAGIDAGSVEEGVKELMAEGRCYEPKLGVLRKV